MKLGDQQTYFTERWVRRAFEPRNLLRREVVAIPDHVEPTFVPLGGAGTWSRHYPSSGSMLFGQPTTLEAEC